MKRTGELVLGIIGIVFSAFMSLTGFFLLFVGKSEEVRSETLAELESDPTLYQEDMNIDIIFNFMSGAGWAIIIAAILGIIFGIIAVINIKGNKNSKLAGWMFIISAILVGVVSVGFGFLPALLYLIAGIMCFARKNPIEENNTPNLV